MEEAWRAHIGKLTLQQLQSPEACREHMNSFPSSVVSQGLALTPVAGNDDVQDVITSFLRLQPEDMIPPAASLAMLTEMERELHIGVVLKEIRDIVKEAALEGRDRTELIDLRLRAGPCSAIHGTLLKSRKSFTADPRWSKKLFTILHYQGYAVHEQIESWSRPHLTSGVFYLQWTPSDE